MIQLSFNWIFQYCAFTEWFHLLMNRACIARTMSRSSIPFKEYWLIFNAFSMGVLNNLLKKSCGL